MNKPSVDPAFTFAVALVVSLVLWWPTLQNTLKGDLDVTISMERQSPSMTKVEVSARENLAEWDKDYAQRVLNKIVAKS